jgi:hypothetical protein
MVEFFFTQVENFVQPWKSIFEKNWCKIDEHYFLEQQVNVGLGFEFCSIFDLNSTKYHFVSLSMWRWPN